MPATLTAPAVGHHPMMLRACPWALLACKPVLASAHTKPQTTMHYPKSRNLLPAAAATNTATAPPANTEVDQAADERPQAAVFQNSTDGADIRVIGLGSRGGSAVGRLRGRGAPLSAQLWCLDNDRTVLEAANVPHTMLLPSQAIGENTIGVGEMQRIIGDIASGSSASTQDAGVAFITASAGAIPGGSGSLLHLAGRLRAAGFFTIVAVTKPFAFEGPRKMEAATFLISQLAEHANLVAVVEQDVLSTVMTNAGGTPMTVAEATLIADNALEHTVRCVLAAMASTEVLKSTQGALLWHGNSDTRMRAPRGLSPLLRQALTHPGSVGTLGRGTAVMPGSHASQLGRATALMHLASDAVRAASTSPFLEGTQGRGGMVTVLCVLALPPPTPHLSVADGGSVSAPSHQEVDQERAAVRLAAQAAAGALSSVCPCHNIVMCPTTLHQSPQMGDAGHSVAVEASLLILRDPLKKPWSPPSPAASDNLTPASNQRGRPPAAAAAAGSQSPAGGKGTGPADSSSNAAESSAGGARQRLPASAWKAMSAMAGGTGAGSVVGAVGSRRGVGVVAGGAAGAPSRPTTPYQHETNGSARTQRITSPGEGSSRAGQDGQIEAEEQPGGNQAAATVTGDYLVDSLTAQSLDLPPQAVRWRQQQRGTQARPRLILAEAGDGDGLEDDTEGVPSEGRGPGGKGPGGKGSTAAQLLAVLGMRDGVDVRLRTSGILERDREDAWDAVD